MTSYQENGSGIDFAPLGELNRRKATVYTHPTGANCCTNLVLGVPDYVVEYGTDTTRTIARLFLTGAYADRGHQLDLVERRWWEGRRCLSVSAPAREYTAVRARSAWRQ